MKERPASMRMKQAAAAVGQCSIMYLYDSIENIDENVYSLAGGAGSRRGTGGMKTKLQAANMATSQGIDTIITNGKEPASLYEIVNGGKVGTLFVGKVKKAACPGSCPGQEQTAGRKIHNYVV